MNTAPDTHDKAAFYVAILHDPDATLDMVEEALAWAARAPENQAALDRAQKVLDLWDQQPDGFDEFRPTATRYRPASAHRWIVAASLFLAIASIAMLVMNGGFLQSRPDAASSLAFTDRYATAIGETRTVVLPDGSSVVLGGQTKLTVAYRQDARRLELVEGQALFNVARDRERPFVVRSGNGMITALGTAFDVDRNADNMTVTLVHGVVEVAATNAALPLDVRMRAGTQMHVLADGTVSEPAPVDVQRVLAWRDGQFSYEDATLKTIVGDLNRYSPRPITIDEGVGEIRVSGSIRTADIENWLAGLAVAFDIRVDTSNPAVIRLRSNGANVPLATPIAKKTRISLPI